MRTVTVPAFRIACVVAIALMFVAYSLRGIDSTLVEMAGVNLDAVRDSAPPPATAVSFIASWVFAILMLVGLVGCVWFKAWARVLVGLALLLWVPAVFTRGISVTGPLESVASLLSGGLLVWLFAVMHWSNIAQRFERAPHGPAT